MNLSYLVKQCAGDEAKIARIRSCHLRDKARIFQCPTDREGICLLVRIELRAFREVEFPSLVCKSLLLMADQTANLLRELPSIDYLLKHARCESLLARYNREYVTQNCRMVIDQLRMEIRQNRGATVEVGEDNIIDRVESRIFADSRPGHVRVVNATGTILHTNLGRALLSRPAIDAMIEVADHPINLEFDLAAGKRGKREETLEDLLVDLTGAEAATVVNNNAAAVLLGLNTLAEGKEVDRIARRADRNRRGVSHS